MVPTPTVEAAVPLLIPVLLAAVSMQMKKPAICIRELVVYLEGL